MARVDIVLFYESDKNTFLSASVLDYRREWFNYDCQGYSDGQLAATCATLVLDVKDRRCIG